MLGNLSLNNLYNEIDRNIHVITNLLGSDDMSLHRNRYLYLLSIFLNAECDLCASISRKVLLKLWELVLYCISKSFCNFNVLTADYVIHDAQLLLFWIWSKLIWPLYHNESFFQYIWRIFMCILTTLFIFAVMFSPFYTKSAHVYHVRFNVFIIPYYIQLVYCPMILTAQSGSL